jgi:WD40 repeat protein
VLACGTTDYQQGLAFTKGSNEVTLWDTATWRPIRKLSGHASGISGVRFSPDGRFIYSSSRDGTALKWDWLKLAQAPQPLEDKRLAEAWESLGSSDPREAYDALRRLLKDPETALRLFQSKLKPVPPLDPERLPKLIADLDSNIFTVRRAATRELRALGERAEKALEDALQRKLTEEMRVRVEKLLAEHRQTPFPANELQHQRAILILRMMNTGEAHKLLALLAEGTDAVRSTRLARSALEARPAERKITNVLAGRLEKPPPAEPRVLHEHRTGINGLAFAPRGGLLASVGTDGAVAVRNTATGALVWEKQAVDADGLFALAYAADGKSLATGGADGSIRVFDAQTGRPGRVLVGHAGKVTSLAFHPGGKLLVSGGYDKAIRLWDLDSGKELPSKMRHEGPVTALSFSADGKLLVSGGTVRTVHKIAGNIIDQGQADRLRVWEMPSGKALKVLEQRGSALAFGNPRVVFAGGLVAEVGGAGGAVTIDGFDRISIVDVVAGKELGHLSHRGSAVAVSADGRWLATGRGDWQHLQGNIVAYNGPNAKLANFKLTLWELMTTKAVLTLPEEAASIVVFAPEGRTLATATTDGVVKIWDLVAVGRDRELPTALTPRVLDELWERLADKDPARAFTALCTVAASDQAVALLLDKWQPRVAADPKHVEKLLADLHDDQAEVHEAAARELQRLPFDAGPGVRKLLAAKPNAEMTRRLQSVLQAAEKAKFEPDELRKVRAVQILELVASQPALQLLREIAQGNSDAPHEKGAQGAVRRLDKEK